MNKNKIYIIIASIVLVIAIVITVILIINDNKYSAEPVLPPIETPTMSDEEYIQTEEGRNLSNILANYGYELYSNEKYLTFNKTSDGVYYASKTDLLNLNYDISLIDKNCKEDDAIIFFDVDNIMNSNYGDIPVTFRISCQSLQNNQ